MVYWPRDFTSKEPQCGASVLITFGRARLFPPSVPDAEAMFVHAALQ